MLEHLPLAVAERFHGAVAIASATARCLLPLVKREDRIHQAPWWLNGRGEKASSFLAEGGAPAQAGRERLPIHRLDDLLADLPACHLVKVDGEGAEPLVLQGLQETLKTKRPYLYLESGSEALHGQLMPLLEDQGYAAFWHPALHCHPGNYRQAGNSTGAKGDMNLLCVPRERLPGDQSQVWSRLHPVREWEQVGALFPGFEF